MFRSRIFLRHFLSLILLTSATLLVTGSFITYETSRYLSKEEKKLLILELNRLTTMLTPDFLSHNGWKSTLQEYSNQGISRVTLINKSGGVIFDSSTSKKLENHLGRPEMRAAVSGRKEYVERYSETLKKNMLYSAKSLPNTDIIVRLALPTSALEKQINQAVDFFIVLFFVVALFSLVISAILAKRLTRPISEMTEITSAISKGNYAARLKHLPKNELGTLGKSINQLASDVEENISRREKMDVIRRQFTTNVSHELKTPLASIKGYTDTLLGGAIDDKDFAMKFLATINRNVDRLIGLVKDLLDLASIEAKEGLIMLEELSWEPIILEITERYKVEFEKNNIDIIIEGDRADTKVMGSQKAMRHILDNLVQNAIKYSPHGGTVWIRIKSLEGKLSLKVSDSGIGISDEDLERIFERFYRVDSARSQEISGTGLGLAIVKHLVIQIQGHIDVESQLNKGSTFNVTLDKA